MHQKMEGSLQKFENFCLSKVTNLSIVKHPHNLNDTETPISVLPQLPVDTAPVLDTTFIKCDDSCQTENFSVHEHGYASKKVCIGQSQCAITVDIATQTDDTVPSTAEAGCQWEEFSKVDHSYNTTFAMVDYGIQVDMPEFSVEALTEIDCRFYTGFHCAQLLMLIKYLSALAPSSTHKSIKVCDQVLLVFVPLRLGLLCADLGRRFGISTSLVARIFREWLPVIAEQMKKFVIWLPRETIMATMPASFKRLYPKTTCIIDCSEVFIQRAKEAFKQGTNFSQL